jgi:hypothetical protein
MLGRKQSLRPEPLLADYGPDEALNESTDIEWVNKVKPYFTIQLYYQHSWPREFTISEKAS